MTASQAMLSALAAFFLWVVVDVAIKLSAQAALSPFTIMLVMGTVGFLGIGGTAFARRKITTLKPKNYRGQALLAISSVSINFFNVIALKHLSLTIFYIIVFTAPLIIAVISGVLKHENMTLRKIGCVIAGFLGVVIALAPQGKVGGDFLGYLAALSATASFALYTLAMRRVSQTENMQSIQLINAFSVSAVGLLGSLLHPVALPEAYVLVMMIIAGGINLLGNILYNKALQYTASTNVAQFHYTQIISGAVLGYLIWHEIPTWNLAAGSVIIIAAGAAVALQVRKEKTADL